MKIRPKWFIGFLIFLIYNVIIYASWAFIGMDYTSMTGPDVIFKSIDIPLFLACIFMLIALTVLGWWRANEQGE